MRILYVEDNPLDADLTMRMLRRSTPQLQLETVSTIGESLSRLESIASDPVDLVLIDMHLRDGDGLSLLKHIRENSLPLAVVLITGAGDEETAVAALKGRADDYIIKRKDYLDRLPVTLESALNHYRADAARLSNPLNVLYLERDQATAEKTSVHFVVHASHIHLELVSTWSAALLGLQSADAHSYDVVLMNLLVWDLNALEILKELRLTQGHDVPVVLLCQPGDDELARQGLKLGASSYLIKNPGYLYQLPWELEQAHARADLQRREAALHASEESLRRALAEVQQLKDRLHQENIYLQEEIRVASNFGEIIGNSEALRRCLRQAEQVAPLDTTVLILGETGTGKELLAHAIHKLSPRTRHPLVKVNCAALPAPLIESDLFGHLKGAYTGADSRRAGRFEIADGGTIFLDEVGELPLDLQAKLLRVLESGEFEPVGSSNSVTVNVRVITATNRNLEEAVKQGTFRPDLYYRLSTFPITLPPLRARQEDIPTLVMHFVKHLGTKLGRRIDTIPQEVMSALKNYAWPGNVRELRNVLERAVIITQGSKLRLSDNLESLSLGTGFEETERDFGSRQVHEGAETLEENEYNLILRTLKKVHWRLEGRGGAAELLNVNPSTLRSRMKKLNISRPRVEMGQRSN